MSAFGTKNEARIIASAICATHVVRKMPTNLTSKHKAATSYARPRASDDQPMLIMNLTRKL